MHLQDHNGLTLCFLPCMHLKLMEHVLQKPSYVTHMFAGRPNVYSASDLLHSCFATSSTGEHLETLDVTSLVLRRCGAGVWVHWCGDTKIPRLEYALESMFCMPSQHHAIALQTGCMVIVLAPVVEAARLPRVCPMALGYGLPPCNNNNRAHEAQSGLIGRHPPVSARLRLAPPLLARSKAPRSLPAAALPEEAPASSTAGSRPAADDAACAPCAVAARLRCSPVMPSASCAVGAVSTCSSVLLCSPPALH